MHQIGLQFHCVPLQPLIQNVNLDYSNISALSHGYRSLQYIQNYGHHLKQVDFGLKPETGRWSKSHFSGKAPWLPVPCQLLFRSKQYAVRKTGPSFPYPLSGTSWPARSSLENGPDAASDRSASRECLLSSESNQRKPFSFRYLKDSTTESYNNFQIWLRNHSQNTCLRPNCFRRKQSFVCAGQ